MKKPLVILASILFLAGCSLNPSNIASNIPSKQIDPKIISDKKDWKTFESNGISLSYPPILEVVGSGNDTLLQSPTKSGSGNDLKVVILPSQDISVFDVNFDEFFNWSLDSLEAGISEFSGQVLSTGDIDISGLRAKKIVNSIIKDGKTSEITNIFVNSGNNVSTINFIKMTDQSAQKDYTPVVDEMIKTIKYQ